MNSKISKTPATSSSWRILAVLVNLLSPRRYGMLLCVVLPTLIAAIYYFLIASDMYVAQSAFTIRRDDGSSLSGGSGSLFQALVPTSTQQDQLAVNTYILSPTALAELEQSIGLRKRYQHGQGDRFATIDPDSQNEDMLDYYRKRIQISYEDRAIVSNLEVHAFTPEDAQVINASLLEQAERFVNSLSQQMREDTIGFARQQLAASEKALSEANIAMTTFRTNNRNFDPKAISEGALGLMEGLSKELATKRAQLSAARGVMTPNNEKFKQLGREAAALEQQAEQLQNVLIGPKPDTLTHLLEDYAEVKLRQEFAGKRYELALAGLQSAEAEAAHKNLYLVRIVDVTTPQKSVLPRRGYNVLSVFMLTLAAYGMIALFAASIGDHLRR